MAMKYLYKILNFAARIYYLRRFFQKVSNVLRRVSYNSSYDFTKNGEIKTAVPYVSSSPVLIDVGANNGNWAAKFLKMYPGAQCYLVEANPRLANKLQDRFANDKRIKVINVALSESDGTAIFNIPEGKDTHSSLEDVKVGRPPDLVSQISVDTLTGEALLSQYGIDRVDFLKIDVEGHELQVLKGFNDAINSSSVKNIQFEYSEINLEKRAYLEDFYTILHKYRIGRIYPNIVEFKNYELTDETFISGNFFATLNE